MKFYETSYLYRAFWGLSVFLVVSLIYPACVIYVFQNVDLPIIEKFNQGISRELLVRSMKISILSMASGVLLSFLIFGLAGNSSKKEAYSTCFVVPLSYVNACLLFVIAVYFFFVIANSSYFIDGYIHSFDDDKSKRLLSVTGNLDFLIFVLLGCRIVYSSESERRLAGMDWLCLLGFLLVKTMVKARFGVVIYGLMLFFGYVFVWRRTIRIRSVLALLVGSIFFFVLINFIRAQVNSPGDVEGIKDAVVRFGFEFYFASLSYINAYNFAEDGIKMRFEEFVVDPVIYAMPFDYFGGQKTSLYENHLVHLGGRENYSPFGGELYLAQGLLTDWGQWGVVTIYFILATNLLVSLRGVSSGSQFWQFFSLFGLSLLFISSFRTPFYIYGTYLIKAQLLAPLAVGMVVKTAWRLQVKLEERMGLNASRFN